MGGASPRICEVELCKACSPIFWMALKYTSAASDRAAGEKGRRPAPPLRPSPPSGSLLWSEECVEGTFWGLVCVQVTGRSALGRVCSCGIDWGQQSGHCASLALSRMLHCARCRWGAASVGAHVEGGHRCGAKLGAGPGVGVGQGWG